LVLVDLEPLLHPVVLTTAPTVTLGETLMSPVLYPDFWLGQLELKEAEVGFIMEVRQPEVLGVGDSSVEVVEVLVELAVLILEAPQVQTER